MALKWAEELRKLISAKPAMARDDEILVRIEIVPPSEQEIEAYMHELKAIAVRRLH